MNRTLLSAQSSNVITFAERPGVEFQITEKEVGRGASCIVYHAVGSDHTEHLLKEYYPKHLDLSRDSSGQIVVSEDKTDVYEQGLVRFRDGCERQKAIRLSNERLKNFTCNVQGYYRANGTEYIDMTCFNGHTYDHVQEKSVYNLMLRMRTLAQVVGNYHKAGLLHLDIKPENIYVRPEGETVEDVMLFDFDSVVPMDKLHTAKVLSCTKAWAAPEQLLLEKRRSICPATDLFAIGEIIFVQLFGRHSTSAERRSFVTKYDYDHTAPIFKDMNPKVFPLLDDLLRHTICGVVGKRYQSAEKLIATLDEIVKIADPKAPYLKDSLPAAQDFFVGRENEINEIHRLLNENNILFLNGIGGIGKSELAKHYALKHKGDYDAIIFAPYVSDVNMLLQDDNAIPLYNFAPYPEEKPEEYCARKLKKLRELCDERTLFIVDNLDREDDPDINKLLGLGCKLLITTRMDFSDYGYGQQLYLTALCNRQSIREIFSKYYTKLLSEEESACVEQIIDLVAGHTMTVELLAKQMMAGRVKPDKMLAKLQAGGISESGREKVRSGKDGTLSAESAYGHIQVLFDLSGLDENEQYIIANLSLLPCTGISVELFCDWCELKDYECINKLIAEGWVRPDKEKDYVSLHPVIKDISSSALHDVSGFPDVLVQKASVFCKVDINSAAVGIYNEIITRLLKQKYISSYVGDFLCNVPTILWKYGNASLMLDSAKRALEISVSLFGERHKNVAETLHRCGMLCRELGLLDEAEEHYQKALQILKLFDDVENKEIAGIYNDLGVLYGDMYKYIEEEECLGVALECLENSLEDVREDIATVYNNFGMHHMEINNFEKAKNFLEKALEIRTIIFGEKHNAVAISYNNLGGLHMELGEYTQAKVYFSKTLDIRTAIFGEDNIDTSITMENLGSLCYYQEEYEEAKSWWEKCLDITKKLYGEENLYTARLHNNLGTLCYTKDEYVEAETYYKKALASFVDYYGDGSGGVSGIYSNLGNLYSKQGRFEDSEEYHNLALQVSKSLYQEPHKEIAYSYYNIGVLKRNQKQFAESKKLFEMALEIYIQVYGENHPKVQQTLEKLDELTLE